ncbi:MAG TPA: O-antigen ligase family protein [Caulobacterales bacterium]|nr:O-antigen ligase family protein [Caulobacterales bacterium]
MLDAYSPSLPGSVLYPIAAVLAIALWFVLRRAEGRAARFVIAAMWLRYVMPVFHDVTFKPVVGDFSMMALVTTGLFGLGCLVVPPRRWMLKALAPIYILLGVTILSAVINGAYSGLVNTLIKWGFFLVLLLGVYEAVRRHGHERTAGFLLWAIAPALVFQAASVVTGVAKQNEGEGALSYIGGYNHESAFSIVMVTGVCVAAFATRLNGIARNVLVAAFLVGLYLANYRTSILAVAPIAIVYFTVQAAGAFRSRERMIVSGVMLGFSVLGVAAIGFLMRDRFADFATVLHGTPIFQSPEDFTASQRTLFSSRLYLWSQYLDAFSRGGLEHQFFGFGPDAWRNEFAIYAHNTFISTLYETGALGAGALLYLWGAMAFASLRAEDALVRFKLLASHLTFVLVNMATMGQWLLEGLMFYAFVCGVTLAQTRAAIVLEQPQAPPHRAAARRFAMARARHRI